MVRLAEEGEVVPASGSAGLLDRFGARSREEGYTPPMPGGKKDRPSWLRYGGIGVEFAAAVAGFTLAGYWIGGRFGRSRSGLLIGAVLGIVGGGYNLIRESLQAMRQANRQDAKDKTDDMPE